MAKKNTPSVDLKDFVSGLLLITYLCLGFIPNWEAVDKIAPQWLGMTLVNLLSIAFFFYNKKSFSTQITSVLTSYLSIIYISFILWAGFSYFYAINPTEVVVNITRQVNVLLMYLSMGIMLYSFKNKLLFVPYIIVIILSIEVYYVLKEAVEMFNTTGGVNGSILKGVTANRNITAFSLAIKIPFVLFLLYLVQKRSIKLILTSLIFLALVCLSMIQSRASFIAAGLILIAYMLLNGYYYFKDQRKPIHLLRTAYYIVPLLLAILVNQTFLSKIGADAVSRASTITLNTQENSINQRLRYYEDVLTHISTAPILGVGLGNWKIKSIDYDSADIVGYVVPYHAHSDFIQLGAELGVVGFLLYLSIFVMAVYFVYRLLRYSNLNEIDKKLLFLILTALGVYSIDANLNFPIARPQVLVDWALIMGLIVVYDQKNNFKKVIAKPLVNSSFLILSLVAILPSLYIANQVYKSLKGQMFLLQDFNSNAYNIPLNQVEQIVPKIPNITVTTIPINSVKARYFLNAKKYDKALALIEKGTDANPYLYYSELLKSQIYQQKGLLDSAKVYAKKAFLGLPNNALHASNYINLISQTRDKESLEEIFELLTAKGNLNNWKNYLVIASQLTPPKDSILVARAQKAVQLFPGDQSILALYRTIAVGQAAIQEATRLSSLALTAFNQQDYVNASINFEKAIAQNPLEYSYYENAATANYLLGDYEKALTQIDKVINEMNPLDGKCEYIKALIFIKYGDPIGACPLLETSRDSGYSQAKITHSQYCNQ